MKRRGSMAAAGLAAALLLALAAPPAMAAGAAPATLAGRYLVNGEATKAVIIIPLTQGAYHVVGEGWEGVGLFDGSSYWGVFRHGPNASPPELAGASGTHRGSLRPDGSLAVHGEFTTGRTGSFDVVWSPERSGRAPGTPGLPIPTFEHPVWPPDAPPQVRVTPSRPDDPPTLREYVYVEELPEVVTKVPPAYPQAARDAKIQGTVILQALVGEDGRVKDTKIVKSIPGLDEAAVECVRKWVFKPALSKGKAVATWVAVPVRFSLH